MELFESIHPNPEPELKNQAPEVHNLYPYLIYGITVFIGIFEG